MKVILVNGGPHKDGCTNRALEEISKNIRKEWSRNRNFLDWK